MRQLVDVKGHKREEEDLSRERSEYYIQREPNNKEIRRAYTTLREENFRLQSRERILTMQLENSRILSADRLAIFASQLATTNLYLTINSSISVKILYSIIYNIYTIIIYNICVKKFSIE